jgi:HSP20 family molecular chaperone IbpA
VELKYVDVQLANGTLTITLPKKAVAKPKGIEVQVSNN